MNRPGPAVCSRAARTHEQAGADRATDRDHLKLSRFEALVVAGFFVGQR